MFVALFSRAPVRGLLHHGSAVLPLLLLLLLFAAATAAAACPFCHCCCCCSVDSAPLLMLRSIFCCVAFSESAVLMSVKGFRNQTISLVDWMQDHQLVGGFAYVGVFAVGASLCFPEVALAIGAGASFSFPVALLTTWVGGVLGSLIAFLVGRHCIRGLVSRMCLEVSGRALGLVERLRGWMRDAAVCYVTGHQPNRSRSSLDLSLACLFAVFSVLAAAADAYAAVAAVFLLLCGLPVALVPSHDSWFVRYRVCVPSSLVPMPLHVTRTVSGGTLIWLRYFFCSCRVLLPEC